MVRIRRILLAVTLSAVGANVALAAAAQASDAGTAPTAGTVTVPALAKVGASVPLQATFNDPSQTLSSCSFTTGDGGTATGTLTRSGQVATCAGTYMWAAGGGYLVSATAGPVTESASLRVVVAPSVTSLATSGPVAVGTPSPFTAAIIDPDSVAAQCTFSWGDGDTAAGVLTGTACTASHTYTTAGPETVTVTIADILADTATKTLTITTANSQTITFASIANETIGTAPFTVTPTASSGLRVSLSAAGACTVSGTTVTLTSVGTCSLTATQAGSATTTAAAPVIQMFTVRATAAWLCQATTQAIDGSPSYKALTPLTKIVVGLLGQLECQVVAVVSPFLTSAQLSNAVVAFDSGLLRLAAQGWLTAVQSATLTADAGSLLL